MKAKLEMELKEEEKIIEDKDIKEELKQMMFEVCEDWAVRGQEPELIFEEEVIPKTDEVIPKGRMTKEEITELHNEMKQSYSKEELEQMSISREIREVVYDEISGKVISELTLSSQEVKE